MRNLWGKALAGILLSSALMACGSEMVNITLLTPIPVANPTRNLAEAMLVQGGSSNALVATISGPSCKQRELRAGFKAPGRNPTWFPVSLETALVNYSNTALSNQPNEATGRDFGQIPNSTHSATQWLNTQSILRRPIVIPVPKGVEGEISLLGSVVEPIDLDSNNSTINSDGESCRKLDSSSPPFPLKTFAIYSNQRIRTDVGGIRTIRPNVIQTIPPAPKYSPVPKYTLPLIVPSSTPDQSSSTFKCEDPYNLRSCSNRGLFELWIKTAVTTGIWIRQPPPPSDHMVSLQSAVSNNPSSYTTFYFPSESPFRIDYITGANQNSVVIQFFRKQMIYDHSTGTMIQPLLDCTSSGKGIVGNLPNLPSDPTPTPAAGCATSSFNFSITDLGDGFN